MLTIAVAGARAELSSTRAGVLVHHYERIEGPIGVWKLTEAFTVDAPMHRVRDWVYDALHAGNG